MRFGVLCSGGLGYKCLRELSKNINIQFVLTDSKSFDVIQFCEQEEIPLYKLNPRKNNPNKFIVEQELDKKRVDVIISINYLFIVEKNIIALAEKCIFNIHGSLLPKYRGRTPHVWSIINNERYTGITAHLIDEGCDTGDIIEQIQIEILESDTGASILEKYENLYMPLINSVIEKLENGKLILQKQDESKSSYFGKRMPEDGLINWNWQKERIRNWVRAQSYPYPGAFSYMNREKLIIDEVVYRDYAFTYTDDNGMVLSDNPLIIKTPNGCVEITRIRNSMEHIIKKGIVLGDENS